MDELIPVTHI